MYINNTKMTLQQSRVCPDLCSRAADVLHVLDAVDAAVWDFTTRHTYVIPETAWALVAKPADLTYSGETHTMLCKSCLIPQEELCNHLDAKLNTGFLFFTSSCAML